MSRWVIVGLVFVAASIAIVFAFGLDQALLAAIAGLIAGGSHVHRVRKEHRRRLEVVTGERDRHVEAIRRTVKKADELKRQRIKIEVEAEDVHDAADDALRRAEALEREVDE